MDEATRTCSRCHHAKPFGEFPIKDRTRGTYRSYCRLCCREYGREHYRKNAAYYKGKATVVRIRDRQANRDIMLAFLRSHQCVDCGESDPVVLDFDHVDPKLKLETVGRLAHSGQTARLQLEMSKCVIRCGNCHRRRTANQLGWYRISPAAGR